MLGWLAAAAVPPVQQVHTPQPALMAGTAYQLAFPPLHAWWPCLANSALCRQVAMPFLYSFASGCLHSLLPHPTLAPSLVPQHVHIPAGSHTPEEQSELAHAMVKDLDDIPLSPAVIYHNLSVSMLHPMVCSACLPACLTPCR